MSKLNKIFSSIPVDIPDRSGFDLSKEHLTTATVGTLVPIKITECLPGDTHKMSVMQKVTLPPFAVPFMGRVDACIEAFFVPYRLLWSGWQAFITQNVGTYRYLNSTPQATNYVPVSVPCVNIGESRNTPYIGSGSLAQYLGFKGITGSTYSISALPFLAYHRIVDDYYIDKNNMKPFFAKSPVISQSNSPTPSGSVEALVHFLPYYNSVGTNSDGRYVNVFGLWPNSESFQPSVQVDYTLGLGSLRQRCWAKDYFTTMSYQPQAGADASVTFDTSGNNGAFTISSLRAANSLQKWLERNNYAGTEYGDQILAHFGVTPPDAVLNRAVFLGQQRIPVYIGSVENNSNAAAENTRNPYGSALGAAAGFGSGGDSSLLFDSFSPKEHGFIMVLFSLVPHAYYNSGVERYLRHLSFGDFAFPEFAHVGDQSVFAEELYTGAASSLTVGYQQRYAEYKFENDLVTGRLVDGEDLSVYALQRGFASTPELGKDFLTIPTNYLDSVLAVDSDVSKFGCMLDAYFNHTVLRVLPEFSLPSL